MTTWKKSPPELIAAFDAALAGESQAERRQMFGYPCAFVNGHMAVGLHEYRVIARVPEEADKRPCVILGRRMKSYAAIDLDDALAPGAMKSWVARAVGYTATMAPKAKKPAKKRAAEKLAKKSTGAPTTAPKVARGAKPAESKVRRKTG